MPIKTLKGSVVKQKKSNYYILCIIILIHVNCFAQRTGWLLFRRPESTKPRAIAAVTTVKNDLSGILYNPSILGTLTAPEIFFMTEITGLAGDTFNGIFYHQPLKVVLETSPKRRGEIERKSRRPRHFRKRHRCSKKFQLLEKKLTILAGMVYYDAGRTTIYWIKDGKEMKREILTQRDLMGLFSVGKMLSSKISTGLTLKIANTTLAGSISAYAFATDLGIMFIPFNNLNLSLVIQNLGISTKFIEKSELLPTSLWFGGSYRLKVAGGHLTLGFEFPYIFVEKKSFPSIGLEYTIGRFNINTAYRFNVKESNLHFGFIINFKKVDVGYSFTPAQYLAHTHKLSISYRW